MAKKIAKQLVHKRCGGGIVVVTDGDALYLVCNKCAEAWHPTQRMAVSKDWRVIKTSEGRRVEVAQRGGANDEAEPLLTSRDLQEMLNDGCGQ